MKNNYSKDSLAFAGYATPDSALESYCWAYFSGDIPVILQSVTAEWKQEVEKGLAGKNEVEIKEMLAKMSAKDSGYTILHRDFGSDEAASLHISKGDGRPEFAVILKKIGSDWKLAGMKAFESNAAAS